MIAWYNGCHLPLTLHVRKGDVDSSTFVQLKYIDEIVCYNFESELEKILEDIKPDIRLLGDDYKSRTDYTGYGLCPEVYFFNRSHGWSTTKFKNLIKKT